MICHKILDKYSHILPEAIVEYIISFTCDRRGYNMVLYNKRKRENRCRMRRLKKEIQYFGYLNYSIAWLRTAGRQKRHIPEFLKSLKEGKPRVVYHIGCYGHSCQERKPNDF
tara:strand:- start:169 stop:504 length:336 start_codon:yes stop_codon:yes gene_type:complete